jgi:hypothetical protein
MKRFNDAISALVKGYIHGTLAKGACAACAVGNIVAKGIGCDIVSHDGVFDWIGQVPCWPLVFITESSGNQSILPENYFGSIKDQIDSTGYTWQELAKVEKAFEQNTKISFENYENVTPEEIDKDQLNGLYAVVDVLCEIEGIKEVEEYKLMFVK